MTDQEKKKNPTETQMVRDGQTNYSWETELRVGQVDQERAVHDGHSLAEEHLVMPKLIDKKLDQEKNEVLAKWVGFTFDELSRMWLAPDGSSPYPHFSAPDLLHSLDAQAKWLWPKLNRDGWFVNLMQSGDGSYWKARLWTPYSGTSEITLENIAAKPVRDGPTPAEACAEAILSLIGGNDETVV